MAKKSKTGDRSEKRESMSIPTMAFEPHARKILEHLVANGGSTNREAIQTLINVSGGALNHAIKSMKLYNLMTRTGLKFTFTPMSEGFIRADEQGRKRIYAKAMLSVPIYKRFVMDKDFDTLPPFKNLKKIFYHEYKITRAKSSKLANIFIKNTKFLGIDFAYLKKLTKEGDEPQLSAQPKTSSQHVLALSDSFAAQSLALELLYAVSHPRNIEEIVHDIISHKHEFSPEKQALVDALDRAKHNQERLKIVAETIAESLTGTRKTTKKESKEE